VHCSHSRGKLKLLVSERHSLILRHKRFEQHEFHLSRDANPLTWIRAADALAGRIVTLDYESLCRGAAPKQPLEGLRHLPTAKVKPHAYRSLFVRTSRLSQTSMLLRARFAYRLR